MLLLKTCDNKDAEQVVARCKPNCFNNNNILPVGSGALLAWCKQHAGNSTVLSSPTDSRIVCVGTPIYRGLTNKNGLGLALAEHRRAGLDTMLLHGAFCLGLVSDNRLDVITDASNLYSIFGDRKNGVLSTSLKAVLIASEHRQEIDRDALCEQLVTGAITGGDTCFNNIKRLNGCGTFKAGGVEVTCQQAVLSVFDTPTTFKTAEACVDFQLGVLREHFQNLRSVAGDSGVSMGLSGGYDSRLMLLLALEAGIPIHPFTYTSPAHNNEQRIASTLSESAGLKLRVIPVRKYENLSEVELEENIQDALSYYDGRTNATMGSFNDVHTRRNQEACVGNAVLNLNGLGGELYRNRERLPPGRFSFRDWLTHYVIGPQNDKLFFSSASRAHFEDYLVKKYAKLLGVESLKWFDRQLARRYYRDILLPYHAGPKLSAENQVSMALMPFAEAHVSAAALLATPFIGSYGDFEAAMIQRLDERLARLPSTYGPGFVKVPLHRRLKAQLMALVPISARLARHGLLHHFHTIGDERPGRWCARFADPIRLLRDLRLPLNLDYLLADTAVRGRTLYIAEFLHNHREHIDFGRE